jgi:hypothetical protein
LVTYQNYTKMHGQKNCVKLVTYQNYTKMQGQKNCASSWLPTRIIRKCTVRKIVRQVGYLPEFYENARSEKLCVKLVTYQNYTKIHGQKNCASSWLPTRILRKCTVRKTVRQVGYLPELYEDARSEKLKILKTPLQLLNPRCVKSRIISSYSMVFTSQMNLKPYFRVFL